jgi:hypothetical protein
MTDTGPAHPDCDSYAMVAQACAMAVQDAVAYLRNIETVSSAVIAVAQERLLADPGAENPLRTIATAQETVAAAVKTLEAVSAAAAKILTEFPRT